MTLRQGLLAYHLVRGTLNGPAIKLKEILEDKESQYFDFRPDDILPVLRPVRTSTFPTQKEYRGCRMLSVTCTDYRTTFSYTALPRAFFVFDVHYCLRRHTIEVSNETYRKQQNSQDVESFLNHGYTDQTSHSHVFQRLFLNQIITTLHSCKTEEAILMYWFLDIFVCT